MEALADQLLKTRETPRASMYVMSVGITPLSSCYPTPVALKRLCTCGIAAWLRPRPSPARALEDSIRLDCRMCQCPCRCGYVVIQYDTCTYTCGHYHTISSALPAYGSQGHSIRDLDVVKCHIWFSACKPVQQQQPTALQIIYLQVTATEWYEVVHNSGVIMNGRHTHLAHNYSHYSHGNYNPSLMAATHPSGSVRATDGSCGRPRPGVDASSEQRLHHSCRKWESE